MIEQPADRAAATLSHQLSVHPFLRGIDPEAMVDLAACARLERFETGHTIFATGDEATSFYLIRTGMVTLGLPRDAHHQITIQQLKEGDALGWSWLFPPYSWQFDAIARTPVQAIAFDGACLRELFSTNHELGYTLTSRLSRVIADRLSAARRQVSELSRP